MTRRLSIRHSVGCILIAAAIAASTVGLIVYANAHSRRRVIGTIDAHTGYQLQYTISNRYMPGSLERMPDVSWAATYVPRPQPAWIAWLQSHLNGSAKGPVPPAWQVLVTQITIPPGDIKLEDERESPNYKPRVLPTVITTIEFSHRLVAGYPATWVVADWNPAAIRSGRQRAFELVVHPVHMPIIYAVQGISASPTDDASIRCEMQAIIDSMRIVKVKSARANMDGITE